MIIKPYSALAAETQNLDDFPSVLHFFKCNETSGTSIACAKTGITYTPTANEVTFGTVADAVRIIVGSNTANTTSAALTAPTLNNVLVMAVVSAFTADDGFSIKIGNNASGIHQIILDDTSAGANVIAGHASATTVAATKASVNATESQCVMAMWNGSNSMDARTFSDAVTPVESTADAVGSTAITSFSNKLFITSPATAPVDIYGILVMQLTNEPSNAFVQAMLNWHRWAWKNGYKAVYPGLKGMS